MRVLWFVPALAVAGLIAFFPPTESQAQIKDDVAALKTMKVPEGFEIRLFAGADICHNPTAIDAQCSLVQQTSKAPAGEAEASGEAKASGAA